MTYNTSDRANGNVILQNLLPKLPKRPRRLLNATSFRYTDGSDTLTILCSVATADAVYMQTKNFMLPLREVAIELQEFGYDLQSIDIQLAIVKPDATGLKRYVAYSLWDDKFLDTEQD